MPFDLDSSNSFTLNPIAYSLHCIAPTFGVRLPCCFKAYCLPFVDLIPYFNLEAFAPPFDLAFYSFAYFAHRLFIKTHAGNILCSYCFHPAVVRSNRGPL